MGKGPGPKTSLQQKMKAAQPVPKALDGKASGGASKMRKKTMVGLKALNAPKALGVQNASHLTSPCFKGVPPIDFNIMGIT